MGECLNKLWYIHAMEYYSAEKNNFYCLQQSDWISINYAEWKDSTPKGCVLYDFIYVTFLKHQNYRKTEPISGFRG